MMYFEIYKLQGCSDLNSSTEVKLAERLASIMTKLNDAKTISITSLAKEFNESIRTLQCDLNERLSLLPILESKGQYSLSPSALGRLSPKVLRHFAVISGIEALYPSLDTSFICSILSKAINNPFIIKGHCHEPKHKVESNLNKLEIIIEHKKCISFSYKDKQYTSIHPYRLVNNKGVWYLAALDNNTLKTFHLSEVNHILEQRESFTLQQNILSAIEEDEGVFFSETKFEVILKISANVAGYFTRRQLLPEQEITKTCDDSSLVITSMVAHEKQILPTIKYWLPHVVVISPLSLNDKLRVDTKTT